MEEEVSRGSSEGSFYGGQGKTCAKCNSVKRLCDKQRPCRRCVKLGCGSECVDFVPKARKRRLPGEMIKKACVGCQTAKAKCDQVRPCNRCIKRGLDCSASPIAMGIPVAAEINPVPIIQMEQPVQYNPYMYIIRHLSSVFPLSGAPGVDVNPSLSQEALAELEFETLRGLGKPSVMSVVLEPGDPGSFLPWKPKRAFHPGEMNMRLSNLMDYNPCHDDLMNIFPVFFKPELYNTIGWMEKASLLSNLIASLCYPETEIPGTMTMYLIDQAVQVKYVMKTVLTSHNRYFSGLLFACSPLYPGAPY